jgi:probable HAF family extracellular repeat protein
MKFAGCIFVVMLLGCAAAAQTYTVTDLGVLPGDSSSWGAFINSSGKVTGCSDTSSSQNDLCAWLVPGHAFLWNNGTMEDLGTLPGDDFSFGFYVSDSGAVVGSSWNLQNSTGHGFVWTKKKGMVDLGTLPGGDAYSDASAMTSKGVIVGESNVSNGNVHAVLWTLSGGNYHIHDKGHLPHAPWTYSYAINDNEQIVGDAYFNNTKYHAFLRSKAGVWRDLGTLPGGKFSLADWINNLGVIVGQSGSPKYPSGVAVYWDKSGKIQPIGTFAGGTTSFAGFINDAGEVLGESTISGGDTHAFIWTTTTGLQDLNNLIPPNSGWDLNHASAMNAAGDIVGFGTINGAIHGFLLKP